MTEYKYPTEKIDLPSKGKLYSNESPLSKGYVELRYLSARGEDILTNRNYIQQNIVFDKLYEELVVTEGVNLKEMLSGDLDCIFYASRVLSYGTEYKFNTIHPITKNPEVGTVDLSQVSNRPLHPLVESATINEFTYHLPKAKIPVTFKLLTRGDRDNLSLEETNWKKLFPDKSYGRSLFLIYSLTSINGDRNPATIRSFIDDGIMSAMDAKDLRNYIYELSPGLNTVVDVKFEDGYIQTNQEVLVDTSFFWPDSL